MASPTEPRQHPSPSPSVLRRPGVLVLAAAIGLGLGLAIDIARVGGPSAWLGARGLIPGPTFPPYDALGRLVSVDGRSVYLDCRGPAAGPGEPTVVLEAGFLSGAASWGPAFDAIAEFARVCAWERPGIGRSEPRGRHTAGEAMDDLWAALAAGGERGPYVLAGHSFGGVYARIAAGQRPDDVAGLLMIDAFYPDVGLEGDPTLPAGFRGDFGRAMRETGAMLQTGEDVDWAATLAELGAAGPYPGPATMLTIDQRTRFGDPDPAVAAAIVAAWESSVAGMFPNGTLETVPGVGHFIHLDRPDLVVARIRELVERGTELPQRSP